jgi:hypothetical protein
MGNDAFGSAAPPRSGSKSQTRWQTLADPASARDECREVNAMLEASVDRVRRLSHSMVPVWLTWAASGAAGIAAGA